MMRPKSSGKMTLKKFENTPADRKMDKTVKEGSPKDMKMDRAAVAKLNKKRK